MYCMCRRVAHGLGAVLQVAQGVGALHVLQVLQAGVAGTGAPQPQLVEPTA